MKSSAWLAAAGCVLAAAGPALLLAGHGNPWIRTHPMGTLPLTLAGAFCLVAYGTGRRTAGSLALAVSALAWTGLHGFAVTSMIAVPKDAAVVKVGDAAPDFTLLDTSGAPVRLADARAEGPVALVFFRGAW